jgi:uncharacterized protein
MVQSHRPLPEPSALTRGFWDSARIERLAVQQCDRCGAFYHPPVSLCAACHGEEFHWQAVSGRGTIRQCTVLRQPRVVGFEDELPLTCITVELDDAGGVLLIGNLSRGQIAEVGGRVRVVFQEIGMRGFRLPNFELMCDAGETG